MFDGSAEVRFFSGRARAVTEEEWLACADPHLMLRFIWDKASDRKLRLFACACCRRLWHLLPDKRSRRAVRTSERYADGHATEAELRKASHTAWQAACKASADKGLVGHEELRSWAWQAVRTAIDPDRHLRNSIPYAVTAVLEASGPNERPQLCALL